MTYAVQQDLIDRFGDAQIKEVADRDGDDVIDAAVMSKALADADEEINAYIGKRYDLPLAATPARLVTVASDIAFYRLFPSQQPEDVRQRYEDALKFLRDVSSGAAVLDVAGSEPAPASQTVTHSAPDRTFTQDTLKEFRGDG